MTCRPVTGAPVSASTPSIRTVPPWSSPDDTGRTVTDTRRPLSQAWVTAQALVRRA